VSAQQAPAPKPGKLSGSIVDSKNKPVSYATITLLKKDSSVVNGDLTKEDGSFKIESVDLGEYLLRINLIGYAEKYIDEINITPESLEKRFDKIKLSPSSQVLSEVQITGEKAMVEMSIDKKVFNVDKNITATGGSAADVLQNVPSLSVDAEGNVSLRGKDNVTILIDGKPATLLGGDAASALQSLPASSIANVEVITNPSARYDAQGMSGIINIITKKDSRLGFNGIATLGAGTRDKYNGSLNLNVKKDNWNLFLNSSYRQNRNYNRTTNTGIFDSGDTMFYSFDDNLRMFDGWFNTIGGEYTFNEYNTVTLTQNLNKMRWGNKGHSIYQLFKDSTRRERTSDNIGGPLSSSTSLNYKHKFAKPKQEITTDVTYAKTWVERTQEFRTYRFDKDSKPVNGDIIQEGTGSGSNANINAQVDFTTPFLNKSDRLDLGWKSQAFWFESEGKPTIDTGQGEVLDRLLASVYDYQQQIHAGYASYNDKRGKWTYQGGLRLEYAGYQGNATVFYPKDTVLNGEYQFLSLFPSAYLSYQITDKQSVHLSYTRRTDRPGFFSLMPYVNISDLQDTSTGNPLLIPEFINNVELTYSRQFEKGHNFIGSVYYQYTKNLIERYRRSDSATGGTFSQPQNLASGTTYGLELIGKLQLLPIWDATLNFNFFQTDINGQNVDPSLQNSGFSWFGKVNTNVRLPKGFSLQLNGNYEAPEIEPQGTEKAVYFIDAAIRKSFLNNKASLVLNVSDIFNTRKYTRNYDFGAYNQITYRDRETRVGNITFTYRFGKTDLGRRKSQGNSLNPVKDRDNSREESEGGF
jgi:outer membrane receptor protein involved in Fe transport